MSGAAIVLRSGEGALAAAAPAGWTVARAPEPRGTGLAAGDVRAALESAGLPEAARGARRAAVLVPDATRRARLDVWLEPVVGLLLAAGLPRDAIRVVLATGTHPPEGALPPAGGVAIVRHEAREPSGLAEIGTTRSGNAVRIAREVAAADLVVLGGRVTNHYFAGFSGGAKALLPGVAGLDTILRNHRKVLDEDGRRDPRATNGRLDGNPVREEMEEALGMISGRAFLANALVGAGGELLELFAGDARAAHRRACVRADALCRIELAAPVDVAVAGCGGSPGDGSFMQALKAVVNVAPAVRPGGAVVWVAGCGPARLEGFERWLSMADAEALRARILERYDLFAHNSVLLREIAASRTVVLVSPLPAERVRALGLAPARDLAEGLALAACAAGAEARALVVEDANNRYVPAKEGR